MGIFFLCCSPSPFSPFVHSCRHVFTHALTNCPPGSFLILSLSLSGMERALVFRILLNCKTLVLGMNRCSLHLLAPSSGYFVPAPKKVLVLQHLSKVSSRICQSAPDSNFCVHEYCYSCYELCPGYSASHSLYWS